MLAITCILMIYAFCNLVLYDDISEMGVLLLNTYCILQAMKRVITTVSYVFGDVHKQLTLIECSRNHCFLKSSYLQTTMRFK